MVWGAEVNVSNMFSPPGCDQILQRQAEGEMGVPAKRRYSSCRMHLKHPTSCLLSPGRSYSYNLFLLIVYLCRVRHRSMYRHGGDGILWAGTGAKMRLRWAGTGEEFKASSRKLLKAARTQKQAQPAPKRSVRELEDS